MPNSVTELVTLQAALKEGAAKLSHVEGGRRDAELLLLRASRRDRTFLLTRPEAELLPPALEQYRAWIDRRARREPVQYILGEQEFYGLRFRVTKDVLIPRPETEHLVEALLERVDHTTPLSIVDVGTGSGAIAVAIAHSLPRAQVTALDLSPEALELARENAQWHGVAGRVRFLESDLLAAIAGEQFDAVVSNPPYIADGEVLEAQVRDYEPPSALYAGPTGFEIYERLIPQSFEVLKPGGWLMLEIGHGQQDGILRLLGSWADKDFVQDLQGIPRVAIARR
jgi:release factor glutamine methyltransferase